MLALIALWVAGSLYLITWGLSFDSILESFRTLFGRIQASVSDLFSIEFSGNGWLWGLGLSVLPAALGLLIDGKGQSASGWLALFGMGISIAMVLVYITIYLGSTIISLF